MKVVQISQFSRLSRLTLVILLQLLVDGLFASLPQFLKETLLAAELLCLEKVLQFLNFALAPPLIMLVLGRR